MNQHNQSNGRSAARGTSVPAVSLIVATVGRTTELDALFDSLAAQSFKDFDVIVVDQNDDDRLLPHLQRARLLGLTLTHLRHHPANLSAARNVGIAAAKGEWVGFPDDDCWYDTMLLEQLAERFGCRDAMSGAAVRWVETGEPPFTAPSLSWNRSRMFRDIPVASFMLFFHRQLFERIGGFDCQLGVGLWFGAAEETDLVLRALRHGALLTYHPSAMVHHPVKIPPPNRQARIAVRQRARGTGALYAKHALPLWVVVRGLLAPVVRPLLKGSFGAELAQGFAVMLGRLDGMLGWRRRAH
jgi:glycosyltransferase involved in cell wall biosynthesis